MDKKLLERLAEITDEEKEILAGGNLDFSKYSYNSPSVVDSRRMLEAGKLFTIRPNTRFIAFPEHSHNFIEIIYMCSGSQKHIINGSTEIVLNTGELLLLNQYAKHRTELATENDIAINFMVLPQFFNTALEMIGSDNIISQFLFAGLTGKGHEINYMLFNVSDVLPIQNLLENLIWSVVYKQPNRRNTNQFTMGLLFLHLLGLTDRIITDSASSVADNIVMQALSEIEQNYQVAELSSVAKKFGVSSAYVSSTVKVATGKTFKQLLTEKRLSKAAELLYKTNMSVNNIIVITGYENSSYFYRIFFEKYGKTPKEYRNSMLREDDEI